MQGGRALAWPLTFRKAFQLTANMWGMDISHRLAFAVLIGEVARHFIFGFDEGSGCSWSRRRCSLSRLRRGNEQIRNCFAVVLPSDRLREDLAHDAGEC